MKRKIAFIGHRFVYEDDEIREKLYKLAESEIKNGYKTFTMGTHGDFDAMALSVCRQLRKIYSDIKIEVVITSLNAIKPFIDKELLEDNEKFIPYRDVTTVMYDIEEEHFKRRIVASNQKMIDTCDALICYVDEKRCYGGAILTYKYAKKKGLRIVNLYDDTFLKKLKK